jgi:hemerythrin-like domain-containing protein
VTETTPQWSARQEMEAVHAVFRREFGLLPGLLDTATTNERAKTIAAHFELVAHMLHHHHSIEDHFVWPVLAQRMGETAAGPVRDMVDQHDDLAVSLEVVRVGLRRWSTADPPVLAPRLAERVALFIGRLAEHLRAEEAHVVPLIEKHITAAQWDGMLQHGGAALDPGMLPLAFGMVMYEGDPGVIETAISNMPAGVRPVIRQLAKQRFDDHSLRVHGTTNPPRSTDVDVLSPRHDR